MPTVIRGRSLTRRDWEARAETMHREELLAIERPYPVEILPRRLMEAP